MKPILITSYVDPDLDGVAGMIAYAELLRANGQSVHVAVLGQPHEEAQYMLRRAGVPAPPTITDARGYDQVILVDTSDLLSLEGAVDPARVIEIIDHRRIHEAEKFPHARVQIEPVGAAATLVAERFMRTQAAMAPSSAALLLGAIISNTFNFKAPLTTARDREAAGWLNRTARLPDDFWRQLFLAKSDLSGEKLRQRIDGDFATFIMNDRRVGIAQIEMIGASSLIAERTTDIRRALDEQRRERRLDFVFLNTVELEQEKNFLVTADRPTQALLTRVLHVTFYGDVAETESLIMRKQIVPLLKDELAK